MSGNWESLKRLVVALGKARALKRAALSSGVVVPIFSNLSDRDLRDLRRALPPTLRPRVCAASVRDPAGLAAALDGVRPGSILLVRVGGVAQDVFEYFYSRATLPGTAAGVNAQNMLRVMGKPFLVTGSYYEQGLKDVYSKLGMDDTILLSEAVRGLENDRRGAASLARFLVQAKDPASKIALAFRLAQPTALRHDKIALLLDHARFQLDQTRKAAAAKAAAAPAPSDAASPAPSRRVRERSRLRRLAEKLIPIPALRRAPAASVD